MPYIPRHAIQVANVLAGLLITLSTSAADMDNRFAPENQARELIELWSKTCLQHFRDPSALRDAARHAGYLENPPNADSMLNGAKGTVWDASSSPFSQRVLVSLDVGGCEIRGQIARSDVVQQEFAQGVESLASADTEVKQVSNQKSADKFVDQRQQIYGVNDKATGKKWLFGAGTSESLLTRTQAVITVAPADAVEKRAPRP